MIWEEKLWWCPTPLRPCIRFFYFPWDRKSEETRADEENRLYFETRDELVAAVQRDGDRAWERVQLLQVEHDTLHTRFRELEGVPP